MTFRKFGPDRVIDVDEVAHVCHWIGTFDGAKRDMLDVFFHHIPTVTRLSGAAAQEAWAFFNDRAGILLKDDPEPSDPPTKSAPN